MKKTLFPAFLCVLALSGWGFPDSTTTNMGLTKPTIGSTGWGGKMNTNLDIIDSLSNCLSCTNNWTGLNTFTTASSMTISGVATTSSITDPSYGSLKAHLFFNQTNFIGTYSDGITLQQNGSTEGFIGKVYGNVLCSDLSHSCYAYPFILEHRATRGGGQFYFNDDGRFFQGAYDNGFANVLSSSTYIGQPPTDVTVPAVNGSLYVQGQVKVSSNTILPGATFYQNAYPIIGNNSFNSCGYLIGSVVQSSQAVDNAATGTSGTGYTITTTSATITPKCSTDKINIYVTSGLQSPNGTVTTIASIFRNSTDLGPANGNGFWLYSDTSLTNVFNEPVSMTYQDAPALTSAITYTARAKCSSGTATWNPNSAGSVILLNEIAQ